MPRLTLDQHSYELAENENVLDCLLRHGQSLAHGCRAGACQSCLVQAVSGTPAGKAVQGLKSTLQARGYALACQWIPETDVTLRLPGMAEEAVRVVITELTPLSTDVLRVRLAFESNDSGFPCRPGQYLTLTNPAGISRSYSVANDCKQDGWLELHVASTPLGEFTGWLFREAACGQILHARGPAGDCFYLPETEGRQDFPILLAGTGTGLAPLYGIARDALAQGHGGPITLLHGGSRPERLYYIDEMRALAAQQANFHYRPLVLSDNGGDARLTRGDLAEAALAALDAKRAGAQRVFLCGAPEFIQGLRKRIFLAGVRSAHIHCDAFITRRIEAA